LKRILPELSLLIKDANEPGRVTDLRELLCI
jgi:hypothetical protein